MQLLLYTFRTNPCLSLFKDAGLSVHVLSSLRRDLQNFLLQVQDVQPQMILGIGMADRTRFESQAVNVFHGRSCVRRGGRQRYDLCVPTDVPFPTARSVTTSFCNWSAYTCAEFCDERHIRVAFLHMNPADVSAVISVMSRL
jgi:hypothetical protein